MSLLAKIEKERDGAQKAGERLRLSVLRFLLAEIRNVQIECQRELKDEEVVAIVRRQLKKRQESIEAYRKGGRDDLGEKERKEAQILSKYLPQGISQPELTELIKTTIKTIGAKGAGDFGKVMGAVMAKCKGQAEGTTVAVLVKKALSD